jgi:hypothetical protein
MVTVTISSQSAIRSRNWPGSRIIGFRSDAKLGNRRGAAMSKVKELEQQVKALSPEELAQFREWFAEFDWAVWDRQLERDVRAGKLDAMAEKALREHAEGKTKPL